MNKNSVIYTAITIIIWLFFIAVKYYNVKYGAFSVSPWGAHNFVNITLQLCFIVLPIVALVLSLLINQRPLKYILLLGNLVTFYSFSIAFILAWLDYFRGF
ncbi:MULTISPECIES: hypothetical protein [Bacillaceae]|uniref:hypothetical protein n=1 Tax=Bacillaceae TaxID=186817 RepID=UPI000E74B0FB|nr:hypothetical protein [Bacillus sp. PK3_68]RJS59285.1 hypothetical protein CJ483_03715 [Bacillus sp. PK3_68]